MSVRKWFRSAVILLLVISFAATAGAVVQTGDVNGDGKVSAFDAQLLLEAQAGLRELTEGQQVAAGDLSASNILEIILYGKTFDTGSDNGVILPDHEW